MIEVIRAPGIYIIYIHIIFIEIYIMHGSQSDYMHETRPRSTSIYRISPTQRFRVESFYRIYREARSKHRRSCKSPPGNFLTSAMNPRHPKSSKNTLRSVGVGTPELYAVSGDVLGVSHTSSNGVWMYRGTKKTSLETPWNRLDLHKKTGCKCWLVTTRMT